MASRRRQLRDCYADLAQARTHDEWLEHARRHDAITGAEAWRDEDAAAFFDAPALRAAITRLDAAQRAGDAAGLAREVQEGIARHRHDLESPDLYSVALAGTKRVVEDFLDAIEAALLWLCDVTCAGQGDAVRTLDMFERAWRVYGRSALMLSGGATWGFHHLGVVLGLHRAGLLPHILSGASTGAMIAAGVCSRTDAELDEMYADPVGAIRLDGLLPVGFGAAMGTGALLDPDRLHQVLQHNVGDATFAEAFAHSGRVLAISVSPTRGRQRPRLLTHLTAPEVRISSAALASSALPLLFPPAHLEATADDGAAVPYLPDERWVDGSLHDDLPKQRLARLHNANHFIVSQTNPHVVPFVQFHGDRGFWPAIAGLAGATVRSQGAFTADLLRRMGRAGPLGLAAEQAYSLVSQDYRGDITLHPPFRWSLYRKLVSNPTPDDLHAYILGGQRAVWPELDRIRNHTRVGRTLRACVMRLRLVVQAERRRGAVAEVSTSAM